MSENLIDKLREQAEWAYADGKVNLQSVLLRAADALRALPADPRSSAAVRLAEAAEAVSENTASYGFADQSWWDELRAALAAWRALAREPIGKDRQVPAELSVPEPASDVAETLRQLRACASAWVPEAKLVGNVSAGDIVRALDAVIPPEPACTCVGMTVPWHDAPCPRAGIFTPGDAGAAFAKSAEPAPERCRCGGSGWVTEHLPERDAEVPCRRCGWGAEPAPSEKVPTISDEPCGGVNCANHRCPYMVSCTQGLCDKCGERVVPCPRCAPAPKCPEPGCHEGLLIPPANGRSPDDLPEPEACPRCAKGGGS